MKKAAARFSCGNQGREYNAEWILGVGECLLVGGQGRCRGLSQGDVPGDGGQPVRLFEGKGGKRASLEGPRSWRIVAFTFR